MDRLLKYVTVIFLLFTSACSTDYYKPVPDKDVAYVSFSNLSREMPLISINTNCKRSQIDPELIKYRRPNEETDSLLPIPSNVPVSFRYDYAWFEGERIQLAEKGSLAIKKTTSKDVNSCTEEVTFIPEPKRKYEIFFGKNPLSCVIGISEVFVKPGSHKKLLKKVKQVEAPEC